MQYAFGFGLSYTTFSLSNLQIVRTGQGSLSATPPQQEIVPGGNPALWEVVYQVMITVKNSGYVAGAAVPQLYLSLPQGNNQDITPVKVLRGFEKIMLQPDEKKMVTFDLIRRDISSWDTGMQEWVIGAEGVTAMVGFSSRDIKAAMIFQPLG